MKPVNDFHTDTVSVDSPVKNDVSKGRTLGGETKVMRDVNENKMGPDLGANIKGLVVKSGKGKGNISSAIYG